MSMLTQCLEHGFHPQSDFCVLLLAEFVLILLSKLCSFWEIEFLEPLHLGAFASPFRTDSVCLCFESLRPVRPQHPSKRRNHFPGRRTLVPRHMSQACEYRQASLRICQSAVPDQEAKHRTSGRTKLYIP